MAMTRILVSLLVIGAAIPHAVAKPKSSDDADDADSDDGDVRPTRKAKAARPDDDSAPSKAKDDGGALQKQDLNGHDLGTTKQDNVFERDRFFVDKVDSGKTAQGTLVQGSITSTSFGYHETGGTLAAPAGSTAGAVGSVPSASEFSRLFTHLPLQTAFRHTAPHPGAARAGGRRPV